MQDWKILKDRYPNNTRYKLRKVLVNSNDFEDFKDYLVNVCNAEVLAKPPQDEAMRFTMPDGQVGIVYGKGAGNLCAHNLGMRYCRDNGISMPPDYFAVIDYKWDVPVKNPLHGIKGFSQPSKKAAPYEYCFACKEVQPLSGDQCSVCFCYIKF